MNATMNMNNKKKGGGRYSQTTCNYLNNEKKNENHTYPKAADLQHFPVHLLLVTLPSSSALLFSGKNGKTEMISTKTT